MSAKLRVEYYGITDECGECGHCGKSGLKKTVMLFSLGADGSREELMYWGSTCAARALDTTSADVSRKAKSAQTYRTTRVRELEKLLDPRWCVRWIEAAWDMGVRRDTGMRLDGVWYAPGIEGRDRAEYIAAQEASYRAEYARCL